MPTWLRNPAGVLLLVVLLLGVVSTITLAAEIGKPFGGYSSTIFFSPLTAPGGVISQETPIWWPIYRVRPTLTDDSFLLSINGSPYRTADVGSIFEEAQAAGRGSVSIIIDWTRQGLVTEIQTPIIRFDFIHFLEIKLPDFITGLCLCLIALAVLKARPTEPLNQVFAAASLIVAAQRWLELHTIWLDFQPISELLELALMGVAAFVSPVLFHFALLFPTRVKPWPHRLLFGVYIVSTIIFALLSLSRLFVVRQLPEPLQGILLTLSDRVYRVVLLSYLVAMATLFGRLIWLWISGHHSRRQRRIAATVMLGLLAASPMLLIVADLIVPGMGADQVPFWRGLDLRYLMLTVPLTLAFVIIRYQSMRSPSRLLILVIALAGSALLAAVGSWFWGLSQENWPASGEHPPFPFLFGGILLASAFWSTQATWRGWFGRLLEWDTHSYAATRAFGRRVSGTTNLGDLSQAMAAALVSELQLDRAAVWIWKPESSEFELAAEAGQTDPSLPARLPFSEDAMPEANRPLRLDATDVNPPWLVPLSVLRTIDVIVPLQTDGLPIGLLGLGHRWDEEVFDERDLVIAELVGQQAALFLLAAAQVEELRRVPQRVVEAQEGERRRLAAELHDTVQQFLGGLPFALSFTTAQIQADPGGVADALERCLGDVETMAETVRGIRFNLAPSCLDNSLTQSLRELVAYTTRRSGLAIVLTVDDKLDAVTVLATREALYRVVQQALDNVVAHAEATEARVRLECADGRVTVAVADNGRGCTEAERQDAWTRHRFGLFSMQARLELCGGAFTFRSTVGEGTTVSGWVPLTGTDK